MFKKAKKATSDRTIPKRGCFTFNKKAVQLAPAGTAHYGTRVKAYETNPPALISSPTFSLCLVKSHGALDGGRHVHGNHSSMPCGNRH